MESLKIFYTYAFLAPRIFCPGDSRTHSPQLSSKCYMDVINKSLSSNPSQVLPFGALLMMWDSLLYAMNMSYYHWLIKKLYQLIAG